MKVSMKSDVGYYLTSRILCEEGLAFVDQRRATATNKNEKIKGKTNKQRTNSFSNQWGQGNSSVCVRQKEIDVYSLYVLVLAE